MSEIESPFHPEGQALQASSNTKDQKAPSATTSSSKKEKGASNHQISPLIRWIAQITRQNPLILQWRLIDMIERNVPFTNDVPSEYIFLVSGAVLFLLFILFLIMFCVGYYDALGTTFLSPYDVDNYSDSSATQYCDTVSTTNTGVYLATKNGYWENSPHFEYSNASYYISLTSYSTNFEQYTFLMQEVYAYLRNFGNIVAQSSLTYSLVYWTSTMLVVPGYSTQRFYLSGDPVVIFNKQHTGGLLTSIEGPCYENITYSSSYDINSGIMRLNYDYKQFMSNSQCLNVTNPSLLGYVPIVDGSQFTLNFDVQTLMTALAVNLYVIQLSALVELPHFNSDYEYNGIQYYISYYYSPKFPSMIPMICLKTVNYQEDFPNNATNAFLCGLNYNGVTAMPIFNQFGSNSTFPMPCDCANAASYDLDVAFSNCNLFNFLSGFIFWNTESPNPILEMLGKFQFNYKTINNLAFNASFIDSYWGLTSPLYNQLHSKQFRSHAYEYCQTSYGVCSMVLFSSFDNAQDATWAISKYYYILQNGACRDSISPSADAWQQLIDYPFAPLVESYEKCHNSPSVVFLNQFGITMGNVSVLVPFCAMAVLILFIAIKRWCKIQKDEFSYTSIEVDRASKSLAVALLLKRDKKVNVDDLLRDDPEIVNDPKIVSILDQLVHELTIVAQVREKNRVADNGSNPPSIELGQVESVMHQ